MTFMSIFAIYSVITKMTLPGIGQGLFFGEVGENYL